MATTTQEGEEKMYIHIEMTPHQEVLMLLHMRLYYHINGDDFDEGSKLLALIENQASLIERQELLKSVAYQVLENGPPLSWASRRLRDLGARLDFERHAPLFPAMFPYEKTPASNLVGRRAVFEIDKVIADLQQCPGFDLYAVDLETGKNAGEEILQRMRECRYTDPEAEKMLAKILPNFI